MGRVWRRGCVRLVPILNSLRLTSLTVVAHRYKHALHLAIDANFKLKLKNKKSNQNDFSPGWGYFVEEREYQEHLKDKIDEPDVR